MFPFKLGYAHFPVGTVIEYAHPDSAPIVGTVVGITPYSWKCRNERGRSIVLTLEAVPGEDRKLITEEMVTKIISRGTGGYGREIAVRALFRSRMREKYNSVDNLDLSDGPDDKVVEGLDCSYFLIRRNVNDHPQETSPVQTG